ncbi:MAG: SIR2 family protein [Planctomycetaceae bacterium]|nr:SIR2 family protein [Planctomycetaceae bacterium]
MNKYAHFQKVFETITELSVCKNYFNTNLFNIEEILSLLEMRSTLANEKASRKRFVQFVLDVIRACTPSLPDPLTPPLIRTNWSETLLGPTPFNAYGYFVGAILQHSFRKYFERIGPNSIEYQAMAGPVERQCEYAVITLNYDTILENVADYLNTHYLTRKHFRKDFNKAPGEDVFSGCLAKLHGSADDGEIIPPTWNKTLSNKQIAKSWKLGRWLIESANHIRFIGYSLPDGDYYIQYLLRASIIRNQHLKSLDVLCLDRDGSVQRRYEDFVAFPKMRFLSGDAIIYLNSATQTKQQPAWPDELHFECLEEIHNETFRGI